MQKRYIALLLTIFAIITFTVVSIDTSSVKRVAVTSQNLKLKPDSSTQFQNSDVTMASRTASINSTTLDLQNRQAELENKRLDLESQNSNIENEIHNFDNSQNNQWNDSKYNDSNQNTENYNTKSHQKSQRKKQRYIYKNIDWSTWKSDFVNKILDDSMYIHALDMYDKNTWFYYSFYVTSTGEIEEIKIRSFALKKEDRNLIKQLIKSYQYQDITVFPANSKRERVKVEALMLLGDYEKKSNPSDFNEHEQIRIPY